MSEPLRRPGGRPSEYDPAFCDRVVDLGQAGKSKAQIAAALGCSRQTLDNWAAQHPEFLDAVSQAKDLAQAWWEDQGQSGLTAEKFNATAFVFQMKNRFREEYHDRHEFTGAGGGPIKHEVDLTRLPEEMLDQLEVILSRAAQDDAVA